MFFCAKQTLAMDSASWQATLLKMQVWNSKLTPVKVHIFYQNVVKVPEFVYAECPLSSIQIKKSFSLLADLQAHNATSMAMATIRIGLTLLCTVCFVITIKIYKVTSN